MADAKYFDTILAVAGTGPQPKNGELPTFDFARLGRAGLRARITGAITDAAVPLMLRFGRAFAPVLRIGGVTWISRAEDVEAILADGRTFPVPYGPEMAELSGSHAKPPIDRPPGLTGEINFVLGMEGADQQRQNAIIRRVVLPGDVDWLGRQARAFAESLIAGGRGRLDAIGDLSIRVPTEICRRYFGLDFGDPDAFAEWAISLSALLFADPFGDAATRETALAAAMRLRRIIGRAIARARAAADNSADPSSLTVVERLVALSRREPALALGDAEILAIVLGLVVGFIPTNGLAAAKMLEEILRRRDAFAQAREAATANDAARLEAILLEAGRLNPALAPGQWRYCPAGGTVAGRTIPAGATLMVSTMSAMRDRRRWAHPDRFDATRRQEPKLIFGHGVHECIGKHLAIRIIRETLLPLFALPGLRAAGRMQRVGYFPRRLDMAYDGPASGQTPIIVAIPLADVTAADAIRAALRDLGNPASQAVGQALDATGIIHFTSCSLIDVGAPTNRLLVEINADGQRDAAIEAYATAMAPWLAPIVEQVTGRTEPLADVLRRHVLDLHFWPWGSTGLHFQGMAEFQVADIARQDALHTHVRAALASAMAGGERPRPLRTLDAVRRRLREAAQGDPALLALDALSVAPTHSALDFARQRPKRAFLAPLADVWAAGLNRIVVTALGVTWLAMLLLCYHALHQGDWLSLPHLWGSLKATGSALQHLHLNILLASLARGGLLLLGSGMLALLFWLALLAALALAFRRGEALELPDDRAPDLDHLRAIGEREDSPTHAQNHIIAVTALKPGLMRRLSFAFALWGIRQSLRWFRTGYVVTMGTIHYARWFRVPGTTTMVFQSNYDGSWESYLEDFIARAHQGQTAAWSNGVGFPRAEWLTEKGAEDGDRFKRWVRRQQVPTDFWYSRFPQLTTQEIRRNALVQDGLARARTDTAARAWLDLFGSAPRQDGEIEADEIQSIVFRGLKRGYFGACLPVRLPPDRAGTWLAWLRAGGSGRALSFGEYPARDHALHVALSPTGLARFDAALSDAAAGLDLRARFPGAFALGMAARSKILRDPPPGDAALRWSDVAAPGADADVADAVLLIYEGDRAALDKQIARHRAWLAAHGGAIVHEAIRTVMLGHAGEVLDGTQPGDASHEHFGFRDGISQPTIRGTEHVAGMDGGGGDVVAPGEFILGYRNNQGYFPPGVTVPAVGDEGDALPVEADARPFGHPDFGGRDDLLPTRDLGRNGSFLVIRQLQQDVRGFHDFARAKAAEVAARHDADWQHKVLGEPVDGEWIAARMMGRWPDGRPLVGHARAGGGPAEGEPGNDFLYGRDDPRGLACPLGAHIRRANPRDSLEPGDAQELAITDRHRLLRRGRSYVYDPARGEYLSEHAHNMEVERGMLFMCLCGDIERQFEFVQQTWMTLPSFHGLSAEPDPVTTDARQPGARCFTIPTVAGPLVLDDMKSFVTLRGGGYFFLPSRSAIDYLAAAPWMG